MIRIAIVEDDANDARRLSAYIDRWCAETHCQSLPCTVYPDAVQFLEEGSQKADVVIMDIEMPYMNGMDAAAKFRRLNQEALLIFATRATRYAVRGYAVDAIGYLVKPIAEPDFRLVMDKAQRLYAARRQHKNIVLKTNEGVVSLKPNRIRYIEVVSHMLHIHTDGPTYTMWSSIGQIQELLPEQFVPCHRGYIVNLDHVDCLQKDGLRLMGDPHLFIPVSRQKRAPFLQALTQHYAQAMGE